MEEIKAPKKERKFLKAMGDIALTLFRELLLGVGKKVINKIGNKRQGLVIALVMVAGISYASIDSIPYPITGNKQRLGFQTTGNGLVYRGTAADTVTKPTSYADKNVKAYLILDSVSGSLYVFRQGAWAAISGAGGFTQPVDSLFFDTSVPSNNVDTAKMRWDSELGTVVLGMYDQVPNELGFKSFWLVKNQTGSTITKGSIVYANGTVGASGRITIDKFIADGSIDAKYLIGITAHDLTNGEDGYVISFGKIRQVNTDTFAAGAILYPSPTVAGVWTDVEPVAPNIDMPIGFCINSHVNNGTIAIRVASGYDLSELHDVAITSPVDKSSLYYSGGLWRDTTATLLVSDTASMLSNYATKAYADTTGRFYARQEFRSVSSSTLTWTQSDTLVVNDTTSLQVYRNGQILLPNQYTVPTSTSVVIASTSYKAGENYTVILPRGGGGGGSGSGSLTSITAGTGIVVSPNPITTTGTVSADLTVMMELTDTTLLNLTTRFATKQNNITLTTTGTSGASTLVGSTLNIPQYSGGGTGTVTSVASGYGLLGGPITTTGTLTVDTSTVYDFVRDSIVAVEIGGDTIKILKQEYTPATTDTLTWTVTSKFPIQLRQFILLFRNGQLLLNDQFSIIDTNKVKVAASSFKLGENYTLVTVSGIGSVSSAQGNPVYPEAGIALSTGTTWTTSITNNSSNWNTAFTDRLKWDGGSTGLVAATGRTSLGGTTIGQSMFTLTNPSAITFPRFNADNTVDARSAVNFRSDIGAGTVTEVDASTTVGNPISITNKTTTPTIELLSATSGRNGYLTSTDWTTFNNKQNALSNASGSVSGILTSTDWTTFNNKQNALTLTTTGTSGAATLVGATLNIPQYTSGGGGTGTVTSVAMTVPSFLQVTGSPITTSGTLAVSLSGNALQLANGGTGATTAANARITLGGTTSGISLFTLTNSVTDKFIKVNSNNTITLLNAADTRTTIGAGTGSVSSVGMTVPTFLSVSGSPVTSSGTLAVSLSGVPLPVANGGTGGANEADARNNLGAACKSCTETLTGNKTFSGTVTLSSVSGTATSVIGRSSTGQVVGVNVGNGLNLTSGTLTATAFGNDSINVYLAINGPGITLSSSFGVYSHWYVNINQASTVTITLPSASGNPNKTLVIKNTGAGAVNSAATNVEPLNSTSLTSAILVSGGGKYATLVSNGTNWIKMAGN